MIVTDIKALIAPSCAQCEYGDIRSMLDEYIPTPTWGEQVALITFLNARVRGASFEFSHAEGWSYIEEEL